MVHCYDEFTQLKEVIVADVTNANLDTIDSSFLFFFKNFYKDDVPGYEKKYSYKPEVIEARQNDLDEFARILQSLGIKVHRPKRLERVTPTRSPYWEATTKPCDNPRDQVIIIGDTIVETPPIIRNRFGENTLMRDIFKEHFLSGSRGIAAPHAAMTDESYDGVGNDSQNEIMFDGAQITKVGRDILFNVINKNSELGFQWISRLFPEYRWHSLHLQGDHLDGEFMILRPGLILCKEYYVTRKELFPKFMQKGDFIGNTDIASLEEYNLASSTITLNGLVINENQVILDLQAATIPKILEKKYKFDVIIHQMRYPRSFGGLLHCASLDLIREGSLIDYS